MTRPDEGWYRQIWTLDIKDLSWTEDTRRQVDFITGLLGLSGSEAVLDLACGFGRHSLELARRGFPVTGVDITPEFVEDAKLSASRESLKATFICDDIRNLTFRDSFDVVLNVADGAIGYLENDAENEKVFDRIAQALKRGGKHFMDLCNAAFAARHFPMRNWEIGTKALALPEFSWDAEAKRMLYGGWTIKFGTVVQPPESIEAHSSIRLYSLAELAELYASRGMEIVSTRGNYTDEPASDERMGMQVYGRKTT